MIVLLIIRKINQLGVRDLSQNFTDKGTLKFNQMVSHLKFHVFYISYSSEIDRHHRVRVYMKKKALGSCVENVSKIILTNKNCFYFDNSIFLQPHMISL